MRSPASFSGAERNRALSARAPSTRRGVDGAAAAAFAEALHEAQPLVLAPTAHTWFDGSPLPKKTQFLFPSNRSSASTVAPNRSASPVDGVASTATREVESRAGEGGAGSSGTDTMRKEMIRLYDTNVELREQVERLQACLRREGAAQMAECKRRCCERCAELEAALRTEQSRSAEKDKAIAALREKLLEEGRSTTCLNTSRVGGADIVGGSLKDRLLADGHQLAPPAHHAAAHLVLQEEIAMLKTKLSQLGPNKSHASEQWKATQMSSQSQNDPVQSQTPHSRASDSRRGNPMELTERNVTHRAYDAWHPVAPEHGELKQGGPLSSHEEETGAAVSLWNRLPRTTLPSAMAATHTPQSTSSRAFTPQTLADLSEFAAKMPSKTVNQPWYNDDEVKEVVSSSRASRLRVSTSPRRLLQPSYVGTLSRGAQVGSRQRSWCNTSTREGSSKGCSAKAQLEKKQKLARGLKKNVMNPSFLEQVLSYPERETLMAECPALVHFFWREFVAAMQGGGRVTDPLNADDAVSVLLSATSVGEITERVFSEPRENTIVGPFWCTLREALECVWDPAPECPRQWRLYEVAGIPRLYGREMPRMPLAEVSMQNTLHASRSVLRMVTACALAGSIEPLGDKRGKPIAAMLQFSRLVPPPTEDKGITSDGLGFCMQPLQQQWWILISVALDRVLALTSVSGVSRAQLWQLLAVLFELDSSQFIYRFPTKEKDLAAFQLLARLSEVGLVYPLLCNGQQCFALSPHFHHGICWSSTAPLCTAALLDDEGSPSHRVRREDEDTIITETNFRLYAYTKNPDLLNILDQFAVKESEVDKMIACYRVTRASFASALQKGISASHILRFLAVKAHPSMLKHYNSSGGEPSEVPCSTAAGVGKGLGNVSDARLLAVIPQSFCDQLLTWEKECRRLIFSHDLVLLRNATGTQREVLIDCLSRCGEGHAVVHEDHGSLIIHRDVYERVLAPLISTG